MIRNLFLISLMGIAVGACDKATTSPSSTLTLTSVQPTSGPVGTGVIMTGTDFAGTAATSLNTINFGASAYPNSVSANTTTIAFTIPTATNPPCRNVTPPCAIASALITPGTYDISVTNSKGTSNSITFMVTGS